MRPTVDHIPAPLDSFCMRAMSLCGALLVVGISFSCARHAAAQRINAGVSSRVTDSAPSVRAGTIARGPGGEHVGLSSYSTDQSTSHVATGRAKDYGQKSTWGSLGETAAPGGTASFGNGGDFPDTDFVATMPKPNYSPPSAASKGFGLHISGGLASGGSAFATSQRHAASTSVPVSHLKTAESIMSPFTPSIGTHSSFGSLPSTTVGRLP